jgi:hypothetical protein
VSKFLQIIDHGQTFSFSGSVVVLDLRNISTCKIDGMIHISFTMFCKDRTQRNARSINVYMEFHLPIKKYQNRGSTQIFFDNFESLISLGIPTEDFIFLQQLLQQGNYACVTSDKPTIIPCMTQSLLQLLSSLRRRNIKNKNNLCRINQNSFLAYYMSQHIYKGHTKATLLQI